MDVSSFLILPCRSLFVTVTAWERMVECLVCGHFAPLRSVIQNRRRPLGVGSSGVILSTDLGLTKGGVGTTPPFEYRVFPPQRNTFSDI